MPTVQACTPSNTERKTIPLSAPLLQGRELAYLKECVESGWISSAGPFVERFEREVVRQIGPATSLAVAVMNGTSGLHLALRVMRVEPEDEVLVPSLTFIAPVNAIRYCGAHPVLVDADPSTWQMDVRQVAAFLEQTCDVRETRPNTVECWNTHTNRRVRAILPVHLLGLACPMDEIMALARTWRLRVIEDAAEAIGVRYQNTRHAGTWGHIGVLSFNGNKTITCGGGGVVLTSDAASARDARYLSAQAKDDPKEYYHEDIGYNYRMTSLQAAVGLAQLEQLPRFLERKRAIATRYHEAFAALPRLTPMPQQEGAAYWLYTILTPDRTQRDSLLAALEGEGIEARPLWRPMHTLPPYEGCQRAGALSTAVNLYERAVSLPSGVGLSDGDLARCIHVVRAWAER